MRVVADKSIGEFLKPIRVPSGMESMSMKYPVVRACISAAAILSATLSFGALAAEKDMSPADVVGMGVQVLQEIDIGQAANVWENASPLLKSQVARDLFSGQTSERRRGFSAGGDRVWVTVSRNRFPQAAPPAPPAGLYANVLFVTPGTAGESLSELVSFRLESDDRWRIVGYVPEVRK